MPISIFGFELDSGVFETLFEDLFGYNSQVEPSNEEVDLSERYAVVIWGSDESRFEPAYEAEVRELRRNGFYIFAASVREGRGEDRYYSPTDQGVNNLVSDLRQRLDNNDTLAIIVGGHGDLLPGTPCVGSSLGGCFSEPIHALLDLQEYEQRFIFMPQCYSGNWLKFVWQDHATAIATGGYPNEVTFGDTFPRSFWQSPSEFLPLSSGSESTEGNINFLSRFENSFNGYQYLAITPNFREESPPFLHGVLQVETPDNLSDLISNISIGRRIVLRFTNNEDHSNERAEFEQIANSVGGSYGFYEYHASSIEEIPERFRPYLNSFPGMLIIDHQGFIDEVVGSGHLLQQLILFNPPQDQRLNLALQNLNSTDANLVIKGILELGYLSSTLNNEDALTALNALTPYFNSTDISLEFQAKYIAIQLIPSLDLTIQSEHIEFLCSILDSSDEIAVSMKSEALMLINQIITNTQDITIRRQISRPACESVLNLLERSNLDSQSKRLAFYVIRNLIAQIPERSIRNQFAIRALNTIPENYFNLPHTEDANLCVTIIRTYRYLINEISNIRERRQRTISYLQDLYNVIQNNNPDEVKIEALMAMPVCLSRPLPSDVEFLRETLLDGSNSLEVRAAATNTYFEILSRFNNSNQRTQEIMRAYEGLRHIYEDPDRNGVAITSWAINAQARLLFGNQRMWNNEIREHMPVLAQGLMDVYNDWRLDASVRIDALAQVRRIPREHVSEDMVVTFVATAKAIFLNLENNEQLRIDAMANYAVMLRRMSDEDRRLEIMAGLEVLWPMCLDKTHGYIAQIQSIFTCASLLSQPRSFVDESVLIYLGKIVAKLDQIRNNRNIPEYLRNMATSGYTALVRRYNLINHRH